MNEKIPILLITTGGTIDKRFLNNSELGFIENQTNLEIMIKEANLNYYEIEILNLFQKDSLYFELEDRYKILDICKSTEYEKIIITHGTDTIIETAQLLQNYIRNKTICLFGSIIPFTAKSSDATFNLGYSLCAINCLEHGIYITMNGNIFDPNNVIKNKELAKFEYKY